MTINDIKKEALELMFTNYSEDLRGAGFTDLDSVNDEQYKQYIVNMNGCINRCIKRFESANVLPLGRIEFDVESVIYRAYKTIEDMNADLNNPDIKLGDFALVNDGNLYKKASNEWVLYASRPFTDCEYDSTNSRYYAISNIGNKWIKYTLTGVRNVNRVIFEGEQEYDSNVKFEIEGNKIVLPKKGKGKYILLHNRVATILSANATYDTDLSNSPYLIPDSLCVLIPYYIKAELFEEDEPKLALQSRNTFEALLEEYAKSSISNIRQVRVESIFEE